MNILKVFVREVVDAFKPIERQPQVSTGIAEMNAAVDEALAPVRAQRLAARLKTPFVVGEKREELLAEYKRITGFDFSEVHGS